MPDASGGFVHAARYVHDDFGQLVEAEVPEAGVSRFAYDAASNQILARQGVGTDAQVTRRVDHDSIDRITRVDHDLEHPVDCASADDLTPISDEAYEYDTCDGVPAGAACAHVAGRLAASRALLHCAGGQVVERVRSYAYDIAGSVDALSFTTIAGSPVGAPVTMALRRTGATLTVESPLNAAFGTTVAFSPSTSKPTGLSTSLAGMPIVESVEFLPFGPLSGFVSPPLVDGARLTARFAYRPDYSVQGISWSLGDAQGVRATYSDQVFAYTPAGLLATRNDRAEATASRAYGYDRLLRLTCEAGSIAGEEPDVAACGDLGAGVVAAIAYHDGATTEPPDARASVFRGDRGQAVTSVYEPGGRLSERRTDAGRSTRYEHDALGRRIADDDGTPTGRRYYRYLPGGRLGLVEGTDAAGIGYALALRYDSEGNPVTITRTPADGDVETTELFHDPSGRLIATETTQGTSVVRWHYHHLGNHPVAATREQVGADGIVAVARFWFVFDERGLVSRVVNHTGDVHYEASHDAFGVASERVVSDQLDGWMPPLLGGQMVMRDTGIADSDRGPLVLNGARVYDPSVGAYLSPDPSDVMAITPERYA